MRFDTPIAFILLIFLPLFLEEPYRTRVISLFLSKKNSRVRALVFGGPVFPELLETSPPFSLKSKIHAPLLSILKGAAFFCLVIALARPQSGNRFTETQASGRDIMLVLDISGSMQALDFTLEDKRVDRLTALKAVVKKFIDARPGDRVGLVVFGEQAFTQCPLTLDHDVLKTFVDSLEVGMAGQGTAIGDGVAVGLKRMRDIAAKSKVVILVTDGKNNSGTITPREAAEIAKSMAVKIHAIGIGGEGTAPFPVRSIFGGMRYVPREMEYDEKTLKEIAAIGGGEYFNAKDTEALETVYAQINQLEEREEKTFEFIEYDERFFGFLAFGTMLLMLHLCLSETVLLKIP